MSKLLRAENRRWFLPRGKTWRGSRPVPPSTTQLRRLAHSCSRKRERRSPDRSSSLSVRPFLQSLMEIASPVCSPIKLSAVRRNPNARAFWRPPPMHEPVTVLCRVQAIGSSSVDRQSISQIAVLRVVIFLSAGAPKGLDPRSPGAHPGASGQGLRPVRGIPNFRTPD